MSGQLNPHPLLGVTAARELVDTLRPPPSPPASETAPPPPAPQPRYPDLKAGINEWLAPMIARRHGPEFHWCPPMGAIRRSHQPPHRPLGELGSRPHRLRHHHAQLVPGPPRPPTRAVQQQRALPQLLQQPRPQPQPRRHPPNRALSQRFLGNRPRRRELLATQRRAFSTLTSLTVSQRA